MQRPASSVLHVVSAEFDLTRLVAAQPFDGVHDLQSGPRRTGLRCHFLGPSPRMPRLPDIVEGADGIGAVARPHQLLGGLGLAFTEVQRQTTATERLVGPTRTRRGRAHGHSVPMARAERDPVQFAAK